MYNNPTFVIGVYSLAEIANIVDGKLVGSSDATILNLSTDTRKIQQANKSLFFAIYTAKNDGHHFVPQAIKQNIAAVVVSERPKQDCNYILVQDAQTALQALAAHHRGLYTIPTIGVTGSNGKTIVKEWIHHILKDDFVICKNPKSYNSQLGVPHSVWQLNESHNLGLFEAGISRPYEMEVLEKIIQPTIGVFTHFGDAHDANFESRDEKLNEKVKLFANCETIVCPSNQPKVLSKIRALDKRTFTWGSNMMCDLHVMKSMENDFMLTYESESYQIRLPYTDTASIENTFTALSVALVIGEKIGPTLKKIESLPSVDMRLQQVDGLFNSQLILDYYNADYQSTVMAIDFLKQQHSRDNTTVVLSDIQQSVLSDDELYANVNTLLKENKVNKVIGIGKNISNHRSLFEMAVDFYESTLDFLKKHPLHEFKNETVLLKGARSFEFEKIAERLRTKTHQTSLEVNLTRVRHNLSVVKNKVGTNTKIMAMVKALAYGSGGFQIAKLLENANVDYLGVAFTDEATELRSSDITLPIVVLNPDLSDLSPYLEQNVQPVIYSFDSLEKVRNEEIKIHLEFDTGMHRLGFEKKDLPLLISKLKQYDKLEIVSIFSHLAASDTPDLDGFTHKQISTFKEITKSMETELENVFIKHISNTGGIERFPSATFNMVRLGIGLYGVSAVGDDSELLPVSTFKSYISQIKTVPAGDGIGYGQHNKSTSAREIAVIAVGYADGYNRQFSQGKGSFYINDKEAKVVGNVCMDMTMCDVSLIDCKEGDEVIIFGDNPRVEKLAKTIGTIPYEILTNVSERVNRVFFEE